VRPYLQEAWEEAQAAKNGAKEYGVKAPMRLNLAMMCTIAPALLIQLFSRFRAAHSDIQLDLIDGTAQSIEEQLIGAKAESAVYCWPDGRGIPALTICHCFGSR
jgi:DNA-binding transcriptional LysR family regulator